MVGIFSFKCNIALGIIYFIAFNYFMTLQNAGLIEAQSTFKFKSKLKWFTQ
jgi:hypothetical protein